MKCKTNVKANSIRKLIKLVIKQAKYNDFHKLLIYINIIIGQKWTTRIITDIKPLKNIYKVMLIYNNL